MTLDEAAELSIAINDKTEWWATPEVKNYPADGTYHVRLVSPEGEYDRMIDSDDITVYRLLRQAEYVG